tara:strand:- start:799 stop:960 length:162 start_codon:yes stop_codon:yes gene_type:complete
MKNAKIIIPAIIVLAILGVVAFAAMKSSTPTGTASQTIENDHGHSHDDHGHEH